jgi:hypothetical protein
MTGNENYLSYVNEQAAAELAAEAQHSRDRFLQLSGIVLKELLETQNMNAQFTGPDEPLDYWVRRDVTMAATPDKSIGSTTMSFMLEGYNHFQKRIERLRVLIPTTDGFNQQDLEEIDALPIPDTVYTERLIPPAAEGEEPTVLSRYAINRERAYPYTVDDGEIVEQVDDSSFEQLFGRVVPEELTRLVRLRLDMVKFQAKPQARVSAGGPVQDL